MSEKIELTDGGWSPWIDALGGSFPNLPDGTLLHRAMAVCLEPDVVERIESDGHFTVVDAPGCAKGCGRPNGVVGLLDRKKEGEIWLNSRELMLAQIIKGEPAFNLVSRYRYYRSDAVRRLAEQIEAKTPVVVSTQ